MWVVLQFETQILAEESFPEVSDSSRRVDSSELMLSQR